MPIALTAKLIKEVADTTLKHFAGIDLKPDELAISLVMLDNHDSADYRGNEKIYPASIVKLFYLAAAHQWLENKRIEETEELKRSLTDMIVDSSNDATHYVIDLLTDTTSGPELPPSEMKEWSNKRNRINEYFSSCGYTNINVNQKPWDDGPYGRDQVFVGANLENRNRLTTNACAKLLAEIAIGKSVSKERSKQMLSLLSRDYTKVSEDLNDQATCFSGKDLSPNCRLWSKAGWTSETRHDAAYIELPTGQGFVLVTFTLNHAYEYSIIPYVVNEVIKRL